MRGAPHLVSCSLVCAARPDRRRLRHLTTNQIRRFCNAYVYETRPMIGVIVLGAILLGLGGAGVLSTSTSALASTCQGPVPSAQTQSTVAAPVSGAVPATADNSGAGGSAGSEHWSTPMRRCRLRAPRVPLGRRVHRWSTPTLRSPSVAGAPVAARLVREHWSTPMLRCRLRAPSLGPRVHRWSTPTLRSPSVAGAPVAARQVREHWSTPMLRCRLRAPSLGPRVHRWSTPTLRYPGSWPADLAVGQTARHSERSEPGRSAPCLWNRGGA